MIGLFQFPFSASKIIMKMIKLSQTCIIIQHLVKSLTITGVSFQRTKKEECYACY